MSAWRKTVTAPSRCLFAESKLARIVAVLESMRASSSATCSWVGSVLPRPVHGSRPLLLPTTCTAAMETPALRQVTFSGKPAAASSCTLISCSPRVRPASG